MTYGWVNTSVIYGRNRIATQDPRLAGINYAMNGAPTTSDTYMGSFGPTSPSSVSSTKPR